MKASYLVALSPLFSATVLAARDINNDLAGIPKFDGSAEHIQQIIKGLANCHELKGPFVTGQNARSSHHIKHLGLSTPFYRCKNSLADMVDEIRLVHAEANYKVPKSFSIVDLLACKSKKKCAENEPKPVVDLVKGYTKSIDKLEDVSYTFTVDHGKCGVITLRSMYDGKGKPWKWAVPTYNYEPASGLHELDLSSLSLDAERAMADAVKGWQNVKGFSGVVLKDESWVSSNITHAPTYVFSGTEKIKQESTVEKTFSINGATGDHRPISN